MRNKWRSGMVRHLAAGRKPLAAFVVVVAGMTANQNVYAAAMDAQQWGMLEEYCLKCHNFDDFAGGLAFDLLEPDHILSDAETWEAVLLKLKSGMMPPPDNERPEKARVERFVTSLADSIDAAARVAPNPGAPLLRRLNRAEYENAVRDLLDLSIDATEMLPADDSSDGFDNVANVLSVSPALMQAYVTAAGKISRLAVGDVTVSSNTTTYRSSGESQAFHLEGMPLGTRGGLSVEHVFPLDAEYQLNVSRSRGGISGFTLNPVGGEEDLVVLIDGERVQLVEPDASAAIRLPLTAGPHTITAAFIHTEPARGVDDLHATIAESTSVNSLAITGPINPIGPGDTPSRRSIFICDPEPGNVNSEEICARQILTDLATRAFRRPVGESSMRILLEFYHRGRELRGFETGIQYALTRVLVDPQFIFRFETEPEELPVGDVYQVGDYELASRLSFFIWSSIPDEELLEVASAGKLSEPDVLSAQVKRMLGDPKATALVENFATQWLSLRRLETVNPVSLDFDGSLRKAMQRETALLFENILRENRSVMELINADYTFVNERLAQHYGIPNIRGSHYRRVDLPRDRRGLMGHSSILTITSAPNRTSPVIRGAWIMDNILGAPPPAPPPGVETNLEETAPTASAATTMRQRLELHRADPSCAACHNMMDPIGLALENFDSIGKWRNKESGELVNADAVLWDGTQMSGPAGLRQALAAHSELFVENFVRKLMTYAFGRRVEYSDMPAVRAVVDKAELEDYRFGSLIQYIVESPGFTMRVKEGTQFQNQPGIQNASLQ